MDSDLRLGACKSRESVSSRLRDADVPRLFFVPRRWRCWSLSLPVLLALPCHLLLSLPSSAEVDTHRKIFTLNEAYQLARESYPQLAMAQYNVDGKRAAKDVARGSFFPQISIFGDWSENKLRYEASALSQMPTQEYPGERYGLQLRSPLFNMRAFREYERQSALFDQSEYELGIAEAELLARVVEAFLSAVLAKESLLQLESELTAADAQLAAANALFKRSLLPITHVLEAQTRVDILGADVINASGSVALSQQKLNQLVGRDVIIPEAIASEFVLLSSFSGADQAAFAALQSDVAISAAEEALNAARKAVEREKGSWWPEVDFVYTSQYSDVGFDNLTSPPRSSESFSISMRYPLFEGGAGSARLRGAWAEFYVAQQSLEATKREIEGRARTAWVGLEVTTQRVKASRQAVKTAETNLAATRKAVTAGTANITDALLALAQLTRAQRDLSESRFLRATRWLELQLVTGSDPLGLASSLSHALHGS